MNVATPPKERPAAALMVIHEYHPETDCESFPRRHEGRQVEVLYQILSWAPKRKVLISV